jgi:ferric-dicitrate binding protein FerR (iron transport regulator)
MPETPPARRSGSRRWRKGLAGGAIVCAALIAAGNLYVLSTTRAETVIEVAFRGVRGDD